MIFYRQVAVNKVTGTRSRTPNLLVFGGGYSPPTDTEAQRFCKPARHDPLTGHMVDFEAERLTPEEIEKMNQLLALIDELGLTTKDLRGIGEALDGNEY